MVPIILGILFIFFFVPPAWSSSNVVLNELLPHPSNGEDWVELYNPGSIDFNLAGWKLKDSSNTPLIEFTTQVVPANGHLTIDVSNRLNNSGDDVYLIDSGGVTVDTYSYTASSLETSFGRSPDGSNSWVSFPAPSKGTSNGSVSTPTQTQSQTSGLSLSEFYPYPPAGEQEWVEVYNDNTTAVSLSGFKIDDEDGGSSPFSIPTDTTISPKSYLFVQFDAKLNNTGDTVRLLSPTGSVIDQYSYTSLAQANSIAKNSAGQWLETTIPTKGGPNQFSAPSQVLSTSKTPTKKEEAPTSKKNTPSPTTTVLSAKTASANSPEGTDSATSSSSVSKIKLNLEDEEESALVKSNSYSKYLSYGLMILGVSVVAVPALLVIRKKRGQ